MSDEDNGYKKRPKHSQFKKGQSGNPRGRTKGKAKLPDFAKALVDSLSERVTVVVNGKPSKITKFDAGLIQFANKVAKGDVASFKMLLGLQGQLAVHGPAHAASEAENTQAVRDRIMKRLDTIRERLNQQEQIKANPLNPQDQATE